MNPSFIVVATVLYQRTFPSQYLDTFLLFDMTIITTTILMPQGFFDGEFLSKQSNPMLGRDFEHWGRLQATIYLLDDIDYSMV